MFTLVFSDKVNADIISALQYIKNTLNAPIAAENHAAELKKKFDKLKENPLFRPLVHNKYLASKGIRTIKVKNYMLFYSVKESENKVFLYRFMYCRRDWINILRAEV